MSNRFAYFTLTNDGMDTLVDEDGNELIALIQISDYGLSASSTRQLLHGSEPEGTAGNVRLFYTLVDESANILVDEDGNELIARFATSSRILYSKRTQMILHGG